MEVYAGRRQRFWANRFTILFEPVFDGGLIIIVVQRPLKLLKSRNNFHLFTGPRRDRLVIEILGRRFQ